MSFVWAPIVIILTMVSTEVSRIDSTDQRQWWHRRNPVDPQTMYVPLALRMHYRSLVRLFARADNPPRSREGKRVG
jgi:hypothetical protein